MKARIQAAVIAVLFVLAAVLAAAAAYVRNSRSTGETISFEGKDYNVRVREYKNSILSDQCVSVHIDRRQNDPDIGYTAVINYDTPFDNGGRELTRDNFKVSFEDEYISLELTDDKGIRQGSYRFNYDSLRSSDPSHGRWDG